MKITSFIMQNRVSQYGTNARMKLIVEGKTMIMLKEDF